MSNGPRSTEDRAEPTEPSRTLVMADLYYSVAVVKREREMALKPKPSTDEA